MPGQICPASHARNLPAAEKQRLRAHLDLLLLPLLPLLAPWPSQHLSGSDRGDGPGGGRARAAACFCAGFLSPSSHDRLVPAAL